MKISLCFFYAFVCAKLARNNRDEKAKWKAKHLRKKEINKINAIGRRERAVLNMKRDMTNKRSSTKHVPEIELCPALDHSMIGSGSNKVNGQ